MGDYFKSLPSAEKALLQKSSFPEWHDPMLATLTNKQFSDPNWIYECKFDGERALTYSHNSNLQIFSRNKRLLNKTYPDLIEAFGGSFQNDFIVDGEIVALKEGISNFSILQQRIGLREISLKEAHTMPVYYYIFDILFLNGFDLRNIPLKSRKIILAQVLIYKDPLRLTEGMLEEGLKFFQQACQKGWEGIIAKRLSSPYESKRSRDWLKFKCIQSQELVILGYTAPAGKRQSFGSLLVGYYDKEKLCFAGKVGTGFSTKTLIKLKQKMDEHISDHLNLEEKIRNKRQITWLKPLLVGEFSFTEWTKEGKLRHPRFKGLRDDKDPKEVIREVPQ